MLPLALAGSLVLLLSSLSLQGMVLQGRQVQALEQRRLRAEGQLSSAAHLWMGQLRGPYSCLAELPSNAWQSDPPPAGCSPGLDSAALSRLSVDGAVVELIRWDPLQSPPELWLQLAGGGLQRRFHLEG